MKQNILTLLALTIMNGLTNLTEVNALQATVINDRATVSKFMNEASSELKELYAEQNFVIGSEWFDTNDKLLPVLNLEVKYIEIKTFISSKGAEYNITSERILTAQEYKEWKPLQTKSACATPPWGVADCWETTAKRIFILVRDLGYPKVRVDVINQWKIMPSIRSFDSIGLLYNDFTMTKAWGIQWYNTSTNTSNQYISYGYLGSNMKISNTAQKGVSISQDIVNNVYSVLQNDLYVEGTIGYYAQIAASYQHSISNINLATSQNFSFNAWGMGRVFYWNTSWSQWDNMQGVCLNWSPYIWTC